MQGAEHPNTLITELGLAGLYRAQSRYRQAEERFAKLLDRTRRLFGEEHPITLNLKNGMALLYEKQGDDARAAALFVTVLQVQRRVLGEENLDTLVTKSSMGALYRRQGKQQESEQLLREVVSGYQNTRSDSWQRYNSQSLLGASLAGQKKYAQAEPLLLSGYEGMIQREATIPAENRPELRRAEDWIVQLYQDWGKPEKAAEWRAKLSKSTGKP